MWRIRKLLLKTRTSVAGVLGIAAMMMAGCRSKPAPRPFSQMTPAEMQGYAVFQSNCAACHYADRTSALHGPGLAGIFHKPYLPSGAPANDDRVRSVIVHGRGMMPPFGGALDEEQLQNLLAYLHTL